MVYRGITLVKHYAPDGVMLSEIIIPVFAAIIIKQMWKSSRNLALEGLRFIK